MAQEASYRPAAPQPHAPHSPDQEYDFVEEPPRDFFCAVTLELLLDPHQTGCCGHHLSSGVVARLQREGRPCPMCQRPNFETHPDLYLRRKVRELRVRCPYTAGGCGWEGELGNRDAHTDSCLKKPWHCRYCSFSALREAAEEHTRGCERFPVACPNGCGVGQVHRYFLPQHLTECPLQVVRCAYAHVGCSVQLPRSEMAAHTENSVQQHTLMVFGVNMSLMESLRERVAEREQQVVELQAEMGRMEERVGKRVAAEVKGMEERVGEKVRSEIKAMEERLKEMRKEGKGTQQEVLQERGREEGEGEQVQRKTVEEMLLKELKGFEERVMQDIRGVEGRQTEALKEMEGRQAEMVRGMETRLLGHVNLSKTSSPVAVEVGRRGEEEEKGVEERVREVREEVRVVGEGVREVKGEVRGVGERVKRVEVAQGKVKEVEEKVSTIGRQVSELKEKMNSVQVKSDELRRDLAMRTGEVRTSVESNMADVRKKMEELSRAVQERPKSVAAQHRHHHSPRGGKGPAAQPPSEPQLSPKLELAASLPVPVKAESEEDANRKQTRVTTAVHRPLPEAQVGAKLVADSNLRIPPVDFTIREFSKLKELGKEWRSPPFYSGAGGYKMSLGVWPNGFRSGAGTHISIEFYKMRDANTDRLKWNVKLPITICILNQRSGRWEREHVNGDTFTRSKVCGEFETSGYAQSHKLLAHSELEPYLLGDTMVIRVARFEVKY